ncbi:MAG: hypothetical protein AB1714_23075 [Acidobacteriota bacterium]
MQMTCTAGALILIILSCSANLMSEEEETLGVPACGYALRGEPQAVDSREEAGAEHTGIDGNRLPEDREPLSKEPNQEKTVPQTQVGGGAFVLLDGYDVYVTAETYGAPGPEHHFLSSLDEPIGESWQDSILSESRRHGPDARQEYILFTTGRPFERGWR